MKTLAIIALTLALSACDDHDATAKRGHPFGPTPSTVAPEIDPSQMPGALMALALAILILRSRK